MTEVEDKEFPKLLTSYGSKEMLKTTQLQLHYEISSNTSVRGLGTSVNNPRLMQGQQAWQIQTGGVSLPNMSGGNVLWEIEPRSQKHVNRKRKLHLSFSRNEIANVSSNGRATEIANPLLTEGITLGERVVQAKEPAAVQFPKMKKQVTNSQPSLPQLSPVVSNPSSPITVVKFHRRCSCGRNHQSSPLSTMSSRQNSEDKIRRQRFPQPTTKGKYLTRMMKKVKEPTLGLVHSEKDMNKDSVEEQKEQLEESSAGENEEATASMEEQTVEVERQPSAKHSPIEEQPEPPEETNVTPNPLKMDKELLRCVLDIDLLSQQFRKLDGDGDGHISFIELKKSLPNQITRAQIYYLKKIYDMACESTYFGLDEFLVVQLMCKVMTEFGSSLSDIYKDMDLMAVETRLQAYTKLFSEADAKQVGVISVALLKNVLSAALNVHTDSLQITRILNVMKKAPCDSVYCAEFLAFLPYIVGEESSGR